MVCGANLVYLDYEKPLSCHYCGQSRSANAHCQDGHFVCDQCHAKDHVGWTIGSDLYTYTCLDKRFAVPIHRRGGEIIITVGFRAKWSVGGLSGEGSRFNIAFTHDYPPGGLDMDRDDKYNDFTGPHWWARPAYNMRIRTRTDAAMLMYGGGLAAVGTNGVRRRRSVSRPRRKCSMVVLPAATTQRTSPRPIWARRTRSSIRVSTSWMTARCSTSPPPGCRVWLMRLMTSAPNSIWELYLAAASRVVPDVRSTR